MLRDAKRTADAEREEKAILCQWLNGYDVLFSCCFSQNAKYYEFTMHRRMCSACKRCGGIYTRMHIPHFVSVRGFARDRFLISTSSEPQLSSMDFTLARFALNIAMTSNRTRPEAMLDAGAPAFLVSMLSNPNELVSRGHILDWLEKMAWG